MSFESYKPDTFSVQVKLLTLSGMWLPIQNSNNSWILLSYIIFMVTYTEIYYNLSEYLILKDIYTNMDNLIEHVGMLLQHLVGSAKVFNCLYQLRKIQSIMYRLESDEFKYETYKSFKPIENMERYKRYSKRLTLMWFVYVNCVPLSKILFAIIPIVFHTSANETINCNNLLPYYSWFPFNVNTHKTCIMAYVIQMWPMIIYGWQIATSDVIFLSLVLITAAHFIILQGAFRTLRQRCLYKLRIENDDAVLYDKTVPKLDVEMMREIKEAVKYLQKLLIISEDIEEIFTYVTLCQSLMSLIAIVSCLYMVSSVDTFSTAMVGNSIYLIAASCQLAIYCFAGNEITLASMDVKKAIYESDWFSANEHYKHNLLFTMLRMEKPVYITIGKFTPLTLNTLVNVLRGSYSFLAVLKKKNALEK